MHSRSRIKMVSLSQIDVLSTCKFMNNWPVLSLFVRGSCVYLKSPILQNLVLQHCGIIGALPMHRPVAWANLYWKALSMLCQLSYVVIKGKKNIFIWTILFGMKNTDGGWLDGKVPAIILEVAQAQGSTGVALRQSKQLRTFLRDAHHCPLLLERPDIPRNKSMLDKTNALYPWTQNI